MKSTITNPENSTLNGIETSGKSLKKKAFMKLTLVFLALLIVGTKMQAQVSAYLFTSTSGTYSPITGTQLNTAAWDDEYFAPITLPFTFTYNQILFTTVSVNSNGYITLGGVSNPQSNSCGLQNASCSFNSIAAYASDLQGNATSTISYTTIGLSPNRQFIVQWKDCDHYGNSFVNHWNFQIVLNETSNIVQVIWGTNTDATTMGANNCAYVSTESGDCGLLGSSTTDFNIRSATNGTNTYATSTDDLTLTAVCNM